MARLAPRIEGLPLVAHNAPFDEGCLRAALDLYDLPWPGYEFFCTCRARAGFSGGSFPTTSCTP